MRVSSAASVPTVTMRRRCAIRARAGPSSARRTIADMAGEDAVDVLTESEGGVIGVLANSLAAPGLSRFQWSSVTGTRATCFVDNRGRLALVRGHDGARLRLFARDTRGHEAMLRVFADA